MGKPMMETVLFGIGLIILGGVISLLVPEKAKAILLCVFTGLGTGFIVYSSISAITGVTVLSKSVVFSYPIGNINLFVDPLSAFFLGFISIMSFIGTLYTIGYMKPYIGQGRTLSSHFFFLSLLIASMLMVTIVQNAIAFLIIWEIMSLSSFFLVSFENEKEEVYSAGINYLIAMHIGVIFLISGFAILSIKTGSLDFNSFKEFLGSERWSTDAIFLLFFLGFGTKAGFVPLHTWLPRAHPAAPSHISGLMSGIMIKTGIYGILRIITLLSTPSAEIAYFVLIISVISGILGVAYAIAQHNIKKLLAYHSVENIGIIGIGIGLGLLGLSLNKPLLAVLGFSGGILHVLNHSIFKSLLFYSAGGVYQKTHLLNIEKLGGLIKPMIITGTCFLIGSLAISGLPPFNGFVSEFYIYWAMLSGLKGGSTLLTVVMSIAFAGLAFIGAMALLCFTKVFGIVFLGSPRTEYSHQPSEGHWTMQAAMLIEVVFIIVIGFLPQYAFMIVNNIISVFSGSFPGNDLNSVFITLSGLSRGLMVFSCIAMVLLFGRFLLLHGKSVYKYKTWDCGYQAGNTRMQYTASSFAAPFIRLIRPVYHLHEKVSRPEGIFPPAAEFESHTDDKFEHTIINPLIDYVEKFLNAFTWIQSGSTQQYILYGLMILIAISIWIMVV